MVDQNIHSIQFQSKKDLSSKNLDSELHMLSYNNSKVEIGSGYSNEITPIIARPRAVS